MVSWKRRIVRVENGRVTDQIDYLSAIEEGQYVIAQANAVLDKDGAFVDDLVSSRHLNEFTLSTPDKLQYMDVTSEADRVSCCIADSVP